MSTDLETYRARLLLALRMRDVPGVRIGEALAEVDSHVAETGEDPRDAFGDPVAYADRLAGSLDAAGRDDASTGGWRGWWEALRAMSRLSLAMLPVLCLAGWVLGSGLISLGAGTTATFGLAAPWAVLLGGAGLTLGASQALHDARREADPVLDPRTGADLAPVSRTALALIVAGHLAGLGGLVLLGYLLRP